MTTDSVLCYIIKYGDKMRAGIDIVFSTVENNSKLPDCTQTALNLSSLTYLNTQNLTRSSIRDGRIYSWVWNFTK